MSAQDHKGRIALHLAVERGSQKIIKLLIDQEAKTSPVNKLDCTTLHLSTQLEYKEATKLLFDRGALEFAIDNAERTTRNLAEEKDIKHAIKALDNKSSTGYIYKDRLILL